RTAVRPPKRLCGAAWVHVPAADARADRHRGGRVGLASDALAPVPPVGPAARGPARGRIPLVETRSRVRRRPAVATRPPRDSAPSARADRPRDRRLRAAASPVPLPGGPLMRKLWPAVVLLAAL